MQPQPYVGITGYTTHHQVQEVCDGLSYQSPFLHMVGVLVNEETLAGKTPKRPMRYPPLDDVADIFPSRERCPEALNIIHLCHKRPNELLNDMRLVRMWAGPHCHGVQLNTTWPATETIEAYKNEYPDDVIIIQVNREMLDDERIHRDPITLALRLYVEYGDVADYVLLDASGGRGAPLDTELAAVCLEEFAHAMPDAGLAVAGGLTPHNLDERVGPLLQKFPSLSIDVESGVRDSRRDGFDLIAATAYVAVASRMLRGQPQPA